MKVIVTGFVNTMPKPQRIAGWIYLPLHIVVIPLLVGILAVYVPILGVTEKNADLVCNIVYYALGFAFCLIAFWGYLRGAFDILLDNIGKNLFMIFLAYIIYIMLGYVAGTLLMIIESGQVINPNNEYITTISEENYKATLALTVFIAPVVEEILFRGLVFGSIRAKSRVWAYATSIILFSVYHVWQYALVGMDASLLLYAIQYVPAAYALAWLYERTNCIWMPIFMHMIINAAAMAILVQ